MLLTKRMFKGARVRHTVRQDAYCLISAIKMDDFQTIMLINFKYHYVYEKSTYSKVNPAPLELYLYTVKIIEDRQRLNNLQVISQYNDDLQLKE